MALNYSPLPNGNYTRLLEIRRGIFSHEPICEFKVVCLDDCSLTYTAISYAWGHQSSVTRTRIRFSDGQSTSLSRTLWSLLGSLRKNHTLSSLFDSLFNGPLVLWIDAICINQNDLAEKSSQVGLMGEVYSCAKQVLLWLGNGNPETQEAFRFMHSKRAHSWPRSWDLETDFSGLKSLFSVLEQPYFQRVWVVQEVALNDNVLMACGNDRAKFDTFRSCVFAVWRFFEDWDDYDEDSNAIRGLFCATTMIFIRDEYRKSGAVRYENLFQAAFHCQATNDRDKVFAFQGIGGKNRLPNPDYEVSVDEVYIRTATALLCHGTSLDSLALGGIANGQDTSNLPTWVPDFRCHSFAEPLLACDRASWSTGGPLKVPGRMISSNQLCLQVRVFDFVHVECAIFDTSAVTKQKAAMEEVLALRRRLPYDISLDSWLELVCWSLIYGLDVDCQPVGPEYLEYFHQWLNLLQSSSTQADFTKIRGNTYQRTIGQRVDGWKAFLTKTGSFCVGPPEVKVGDMVCVVSGCRFPLILRPDQPLSDADSVSSCTLVSWSFVHGIMHGEAMKSGDMLKVLLH